VYAFAAKAASSGSVLSGMLTMVSFGLGTAPALFLSGKIIQRFTPIARRRFVSAGTFFILILGAVTVLRGFSSGPIHEGHG
jgi:sulfite exporter TauE/SafE